MNAVVRLPVCPHCNTVLNAGLICADCGVAEAQIDIDAQQAIEHQRGAVLFARPAVSRPVNSFKGAMENV
jgi:hypothetical protein